MVVIIKAGILLVGLVFSIMVPMIYEIVRSVIKTKQYIKEIKSKEKKRMKK